jgi:hypothetical protein
MPVPSLVRAALARWSAWRQTHSHKPLRQRSTGYLMFMTSTSAFVVLMAQSTLAQATTTFVEKVVPTSRWLVSVIVGLTLLAWWAMVGISALLTATHGKALGDKLFDPARP